MKGGWRLKTTRTIVLLIHIYHSPPTSCGVLGSKRSLHLTSGITRCTRIISDYFAVCKLFWIVRYTGSQ